LFFVFAYRYLAREYAPNEEVTDAELEELNEQADTKKASLVLLFYAFVFEHNSLPPKKISIGR